MLAKMKSLELPLRMLVGKLSADVCKDAGDMETQGLY